MTDDEKMDGRRQRGDITRARILDSSIKQASQLGLEGLSLNGVAEDADVSKATVSQLFGNKEGVQIATLGAAMDLFKDWIGPIAPRQTSPSKAVELLFAKWFSWVLARKLPGGCFMHATLSEYRGRPGAIHDLTKQYRLEWRGTIHRLLKHAKSAGEFKPDVDIEQLAFELFACQAAADTALFYDDTDTFNRARKSVAKRLKEARQA